MRCGLLGLAGPPQLMKKCPVWRYFAFESNDWGKDLRCQETGCKLCLRGNTSNLAKRLKDRHPDLCQ